MGLIEIQLWQLVIMLLAVLLLPVIAKWIALRADLVKDKGDLSEEVLQRVAGEYMQKALCREVHKHVDSILCDVRNDQNDLASSVKKIGVDVAVLRERSEPRGQA